MNAPKIETTAPDYKGFTKAIMDDWQEHGDVDAYTKFELAIRHNILREIPGGYDPDKHSERSTSFADKGDPWYEMNDAPAAEIVAAQTAAAWIAGRDAAAEACHKQVHATNQPFGHKSAHGALNCREAVNALTPPTDPDALDRLIAERVREARAEAFKTAADIARAEVERREAAMEKAVMCDSILRLSAEADAAERIAIAIVEVARGSKEGRDG